MNLEKSQGLMPLSVHSPLLSRLPGLKQQGKLPQVILLKGRVSKSAFVKQLAQFIFCQSDCTFAYLEPCFKCLSCEQWEQGMIDTYMPLPSGEELKIEHIRDLERYRGRASKTFRVFVLENVEDTHLSSVNALLKLIEEPDPHWIWLLTCKQSTLVPKTLLSRCFQIQVFPVQQRDLSVFPTFLHPILKHCNEDQIALLEQEVLKDASWRSALEFILTQPFPQNVHRLEAWMSSWQGWIQNSVKLELFWIALEYQWIMQMNKGPLWAPFRKIGWSQYPLGPFRSNRIVEEFYALKNQKEPYNAKLQLQTLCMLLIQASHLG